MDPKGIYGLQSVKINSKHSSNHTEKMGRSYDGEGDKSAPFCTGKKKDGCTQVRLYPLCSSRKLRKQRKEEKKIKNKITRISFLPVSFMRRLPRVRGGAFRTKQSQKAVNKTCFKPSSSVGEGGGPS